MYKISSHPQRSEEWFNDRLGKFTASSFSDLITPSGKKSSTSKKLINRIVAELISGSPDKTFTSSAMERGKELEEEAINCLNMILDSNFTEIGFCDSELGYGCSPDGYDFTVMNCGAEVKCPLLHTHIEYIVNGELPDIYVAQVQGSMMVTGAKRWVFFSYHPDCKPFVLIVERDEKYIQSLKMILNECVAEVKEKYKKTMEFIND